MLGFAAHVQGTAVNTQEFCARWVSERATETSRILDYGCGAGELVRDLRAKGLDAYGCDVFYDGGDFSSTLSAMPASLRRMEGDRIPFPDAYFDVLISNQVIEHVPDLGACIAETARVLKPGGVALHVFPDAWAWHEGHANIPFLHWFPRNGLRVHYAVLMSYLPGMGLPLNGKTRYARWRAKCKWIDDWTHYRSVRELDAAFSTAFTVRHIENERFDAKFGARPLPVAFKRWLMRHLAGDAILLERR
jgi:SAM-dependent methyltransferase